MRSIAAALAIFVTLVVSGAAPASLAAPSVASATDDTITLQQGEIVTLQLDPSLPSGARVVARGPAPPPDEIDQVAIETNLSGAANGWTGEDYGVINAPDGHPVAQAPPDIVSISFVRIPNTDHVMLFLRNGYGRALNYHAYMYHQGRGEATDVCQVAPNRRGYEHWPYQIDRIELSAFSLSDWSNGQRLICR